MQEILQVAHDEGVQSVCLRGTQMSIVHAWTATLAGGSYFRIFPCPSTLPSGVGGAESGGGGAGVGSVQDNAAREDQKAKQGGD